MSEIEKLREEIDSLREEIDLLKDELHRRRGRPSIDKKTRAKIINLYSMGFSMRKIADHTNVSLGTVHKIVSTACREAVTAYFYMDREKPATLIKACGLNQKVEIVNFTDDLLSRAFGINEHPTWQDYEEFLESRCMPRTRYGLREELKCIGVDSYDPVLIIEKTKGRLYDDGQWLEKLSGELLEKCEKIIEEEPEPVKCSERLGKLICKAAGEYQEAWA